MENLKFASACGDNLTGEADVSCASPVTFFISGEPRGKGRPRFGRSYGGRPVAYTDAKTASYENLVKLSAGPHFDEPFEKPVKIEIEAMFVPAKSWSKKRKAAALNGAETPSRFDVDNIAKAVLDGMNGVAFLDDKQVCQLTVSKRFDERPGCVVTISSAAEGVPTE